MQFQRVQHWRSTRILQLLRNQDENLCPIQKYESTKGTSYYEQSSALLTVSDQLNLNDCEGRRQNLKIVEENREAENLEVKVQKRKTSTHISTKQKNDIVQIRETDETESKNTKRDVSSARKTKRQKIIETNDQLEQAYKQHKDSSDEQLSCSESEYVPETSSDSDTDEQAETSPFENVNLLKNRIVDNRITDLPSTSGNGDLVHSSGIPIVSLGRFLESTSKVEHFTNTRPWTKKNACPYCFREVTHFPRHLQRNHKDEGAVKELLSMTSKNSKRKQLIGAIRRQGNYISNTQTNIVRPVRRPKGTVNNEIGANTEGEKDKYIVCQNCLGYFTRNYLRRHKKICPLHRKTNAVGGREQHLSAAQVFAVCCGSNHDFYATLRLKDEVLKIMRNDDISKTAMNDILICSYAESLLRKHKRHQIRNVISNKMRELGRLLISLRALTAVRDLFNALKPQMFDNFISATKIISGYDTETRSFKASSLALHMATTLKQICDVATRLVIQKSKFLPCTDEERTLKDIKQLKKLIENHWNSELSSLALKNLTEKNYDKPKLLPLTSDVVKFQRYVLNEAKAVSENLKQGKHLPAEYRRLSECILALTLLLNRKRIGEIQYLTVKTYSKKTSETQQEEFLQALSETEKKMTKCFKRVVTMGKGSKPVAVLFSKEMQEFIDVLLNVRPLFVSQNNEYLFPNPKTENRWLSGYHTLRKLAEKSDVSDKTLFTSTRLRKQIATILQVLNVTENEMEQLANFMGHTKKTHQDYYRLPQDIYQTAKVSKLLLAINTGNALKYKGKSLEEMDMSDNLDTDSDSDTGEFSGVKTTSSVKTKNTVSLDENSSPSPGVSTPQDDSPDKNVPTKMIKERKKRIPWTKTQKEVITNFFKNHIKTKQAPRKHEVEELISKHKNLFKDRNWSIIKAYVYNCYK